jgi:hypothetical protein
MADLKLKDGVVAGEGLLGTGDGTIGSLFVFV